MGLNQDKIDKVNKLFEDRFEVSEYEEVGEVLEFFMLRVIINEASPAGKEMIFEYLKEEMESKEEEE